MRLCPYCRLVPGVPRAGALRGDRLIVSWACESCQEAVDRAMSAWAVLYGVTKGAVHPGVLFTRGR